jgi:serine/threonine protein phosphatase PrpC
MAGTSFDWDRLLKHAAISDIGMRRANNQDSMTIALADDVKQWYERGHVFLVADGMGGEAAGELASKLAVDTIPHLYNKHTEKSPPEALQDAIVEANAEINRRGEANPDFHRMGTTCETMLLLPQGALVGHVGDSRVYRQRGDFLEQLTFDHSLQWEMEAAGQLVEGSDLAKHVPKNWITRSLGPKPEVKVDIEGPFPCAVGDTFLLCSDGLTGPVKDEEIGPILANLEPTEAAQVLVDLANLRGGPDNITVVIVKVAAPEISTQVAQKEPLVVGAIGEHRQSAHPALWVVAGVCFLAALFLFALHPISALFAAIGGVVATAVGLLQQFGSLGSLGGKTGVALAGGKRLGRGPYRRTSCIDNTVVIDELGKLTGELQEAVKGRQLPMSSFEKLREKADEAARTGDNRTAVRAYCQGIQLLMRTLREAKERNISDSTIDL